MHILYVPEYCIEPASLRLASDTNLHRNTAELDLHYPILRSYKLKGVFPSVNEDPQT